MILQTVIRSGPVRGLETATPGITAFKGIPYAKAPVGDYRWKAPVAPKAWENERLCDDFGPSCWQPDNSVLPSFKRMQELNPVPPRPLVMDEDCLSLNVWTPAESSDERLPVMVWFYGGGLQAGTSDDILFDGEGLCRFGVLLVTVNYRTGVFGYFGHPALEAENEERSCGNYGLRDQIFALQWVKDNIAAFGGDADNVTIFGCSGGGRSVQGVACSPLGGGLVQHAICHSAGGLNPHYSMEYEPLKALGEEFVAYCGKQSIEEMREIPARELQTLYESFRKQFNITGDGYVLPYVMDEIVRRGEQADIDYLLCTMQDELIFPAKTPVSLENFDSLRNTFGLRTSILGRVVTPRSDEEAMDVVERAEAYEMKASQLAWAQVQAQQPKKPVRLGTFVHPVPSHEDGSARHGDDQAYVFHTLFKFWYPYGEKDEALSQRLMQYWTNFAKTGDPNGEGLPLWTPYTVDSPLTLTIDTDDCRMEDRSHFIIEQVAAAYRENRRG